ncbi:MAG: DUF4034 domain-containing protein [Myxococcota bacterium]
MPRSIWLVLVLAMVLGSSPGFATRAETDPALRAFRARRFEELERRIATLLAATRGKHWELSLYNQFIIRAKKAIELEPALNENVEAWRQAIPKSAHPYNLLAGIESTRGWDVRGRGYANTVPAEAWPKFRAHMAAADALLAKGRKIDPKNLPVAVQRIEVATYGSGDVKEVLARFEEALEIDPVSEAAHRSMSWALDRKWFGSDEIVLRFVREAVRRNPEAPALAALLVDVHADIASRQRRTSEDVSRYFQRPEIWQEVFPAAERYAAAYPKDAWALNHLAWLAWRGDRRDLAKREFALLDGDFDDAAWDEDITPEQALAWAESPAP